MEIQNSKLQKIGLLAVLFAINGCKLGEKSAAKTQSLSDLERGFYVAETCQANASVKLTFSRESIVVFGKNCAEPATLTDLESKSCEAVSDSLKTLPENYQNYLNILGMAIVVDTKERTKDLAKSAFKADEVSIDNISSFWTAASEDKLRGTKNYLATIIRVDNLDSSTKDISYSTLRTLGDFFARGAFGVARINGSIIFDPMRTAGIPDSYLQAQARLTKKFLAKLQNLNSNLLIQSIVGNNQSLLSDFPLDIKDNLSARNLASYVTTEALHQFYCNQSLRGEFDPGAKFSDLMPDVKLILAAVDIAIESVVPTQKAVLQTVAGTQGSGLLLSSDSFLQQIFAYIKALQSNQIFPQEKIAQNFRSAGDDSNSGIAKQLADLGAPSCQGGQCQSGGGCAGGCASGGCSCAGGICSCTGGCSCSGSSFG